MVSYNDIVCDWYVCCYYNLNYMTVEKARELLKDEKRKFCGNCGERLYAPFDVLFMHTYSICPMCAMKESKECEEIIKI